jgi:hypothetical protein
VSVIPFDPSFTPKELNQFVKQRGAALQEVFPSITTRAKNSSGYVLGIGKYDADGNFVPTAPFSGEATAGVLGHLAKLQPVVTDKLEASQTIRRAIQERIARDVAMPGARKDIQNMRRFFAEADWLRAVERVRKGATPAAALSALGYSLNLIAADER